MTAVPDLDAGRPDVPDDLRAQLPGLRDLAVDLALGAGELVRTGRRAALADQVGTKSTATDVVTVMDRASEAYLRRRLAAERPDDAVLGEEEGIARARGTSATPSPVTWVVDPIDGTVNYLYGRPEYAVSVAAVVGDPTRPGAWRPVAGAVANPETGEIHHAYAGGGAHLRDRSGEPDRALACTAVDTVSMTLLATGFGYAADVRREQALALLEILPAVRDIRRGGSAALDLCTVASGVVDAYAERGVHAWDVAAGWLVAAEAGAQVRTWSSGSDRPWGVLAAPSSVAPQLTELVQGAYLRARAATSPE